MTVRRRVTVEDREREIMRAVRDREPDGATVRELHTAVSEVLGDSVTIQAYYKVLDRMASTGRLEAHHPPDGGDRRYRLAAYLHPDSALTLDDVYAHLEELEPTDAIARVIDSREYFDRHRAGTLAAAARELRDEDPRELVARMLLERVDVLRADVEMLATEELRDRDLEARVRAEVRELHQLAYRYLGLSQAALRVPRDLADPRRSARDGLSVDPDRLREEIDRRVFGVTAIDLVDVNAVSHREEWNRSSVAGSDGSTYASGLALSSASGFVDDAPGEIVTFNNSVAYVLRAPNAPGRRDDSPFHSVPMSRSAIDDRSNRGMVMAQFMYPYLSESEYEHMAKCATDVVQWRVDAAVFRGRARGLGAGGLLPAPRVQFRDGTITPQEREYGHYRRANEYGDMVREGIALGRDILERIVVSRSPQVFAGAVKTTQARFFATLLNWYISRGSAARLGTPIDPDWDLTRAAHIADNEAMSVLLSTLNDQRGTGQYFVSFQVMRPFHTLTEYFDLSRRDDPQEWVEFFRDRQAREQRDFDDGHTAEPPYLAGILDVEGEPFVFMCVNADYVSFYVGHTGGDPPPTVPRYEFLEGLRRLGPDRADERVARNVELIVAALDRTKLSLDRDHNYLSRKTLVKIIPHVVYEAHEKSKALGRQLDAELRSIVIANLQAIRHARDLTPEEVRFRPLTVRRFVQRFRNATQDRSLGEGTSEALR